MSTLILSPGLLLSILKSALLLMKVKFCGLVLLLCAHGSVYVKSQSAFPSLCGQSFISSNVPIKSVAAITCKLVCILCISACNFMNTVFSYWG